MTKRLGAHVSSAGGHHLAVERAAAIGANAVQVFSGSPRVWQRPDLNAIDADKISSVSKEKDVQPIFTHALYLVNLASENPELREKSQKALRFDLAFDGKLNGAGVVVHVGSSQGRGWAAVRDVVVKEIADILANTPENSHFLIENSASPNGKIASDLSEIAWMQQQIKSDRLCWCLDTCHAFAAGYAFGAEAEKASSKTGGTSEKSLYSAIEEFDLWKTLRCVHVNDSRDPFASGRDRHENLNDGLIPQEDMKYFLNRSELAEIPLILEVPGLDKEGPDAENINRLKKLVGEK